MNGPLVSVLTPSLNQANWLEDNLRSVEAQTYRPLEHIVVDGGSIDGSVDFLQKVNNSNLRWISEPDRGQANALNKALAMSSGDVIGWLNSDDAYFSPTVIASAVDTFMADPALAVLYGHAALANSEGLVLHMIWVPPFDYRLLKIHNFIIQPATFVRRAFLADFIADERYQFSMDRELWLRLGSRYKIGRSMDVYAIDRHHSTRKSVQRGDLAAADKINIQNQYQVSSRFWLPITLKLLKIMFRLMGATLITKAHPPYAFRGKTGGALSLLVRQMAIPRRYLSTK